MKAKIRNSVAVTTGIVCGLIATAAYAATWTASSSISKIEVRNDRIIMVKSVSGTWINPDFCDKDTIVVMLPPGAQGGLAAYKEVYAAIVGAHLTDRKVRFYLNGCVTVGNKTYPKILRVAVF